MPMHKDCVSYDTTHQCRLIVSIVTVCSAYSAGEPRVTSGSGNGAIKPHSSEARRNLLPSGYTTMSMRICLLCLAACDTATLVAQYRDDHGAMGLEVESHMSHI